MKLSHKIVYFALWVTLGALWGMQANAQVYTHFGPSNGLMIGSTATYQTAPAAAANVTSLWSGTCNSTTYLAGNGTCSAPAGTTAGANPTGTVGLTAVNGAATTYLRSDGAPALSQAISPTMTGVWAFSPTAAGNDFTINNNSTSASNTLRVLSPFSAPALNPLLSLRSTAASPFATLSISANGTVGTDDFALFQNAGSTNDVTIVNRSSGGAMSLSTNAIERFRIAAGGAMAMNTPATGATLSLAAGASGSPVVSFSSGSTAVTSLLSPSLPQVVYSLLGPSSVGRFGPGIIARWDGATADRYISIGHYDNSNAYVDDMRVENGGVSFNNAASQSYLAFGTLSNNGTVCAIAATVGQFGITGCTRTGAGQITVAFLNSDTLVKGCVGVVAGVPGFVSIISRTNGGANLGSYNAAGTLTDETVDVICW